MSRKRGKWSLLDPRVDLFEIIEEGVDFGEADSTPILGGKVVNIAYLMILWTGGMEKACEQWEDMQDGLKLGRLSRIISHDTIGTISPDKNKDTSHKENSTRSKKPSMLNQSSTA